jgi:hypothetical protein
MLEAQELGIQGAQVLRRLSAVLVQKCSEIDAQRLHSSMTPHRFGKLDECWGDVSSGEDMIDDPEIDRRLRHSKHDRGRFILHDGGGAAAPQVTHPGCTVVAHAGHEDSYCGMAVLFGDGLEQYCCRRAMAA